MATGTRKQPTKAVQRGVLLTEFVQNTAPLKVDRELGIIYGVKALGWESDNGRRYLPEAGKKALPLYEGAKVFIDHPRKPDDSRQAEDAFGKLKNARFAEDGIYADLHYFKSHPMAARVCEDVERGLGFLGMSHNATGDGQTDKDGIFVVQEITDLRSVDLVSEAATVSNLWESQNRNGKSRAMKKYTIRQVLEAAVTRMEKAKHPKHVKATRAILEDEGDVKVLDEEDAGMEMPEDDMAGEGGDYNDLIYKAMKACDDPDVQKKLHALLKPEAAIEEDEEEVPEEDEEETPKPAEESRKPKRRKVADPAFTALQEQVAKLTAEKEAAETRAWFAEECKKRKVEPGAALTESLLLHKDRKKITAALDELKGQAGNGQRQQPRSQAPGARITESTDPKPSTDGKSFAEALKARR